MKMIASDYDGTLCHDGVSAADRDALQRWRAAGNVFGIVTGRSNNMLGRILKEQLAIDYVSVFNGAVVYDLAAPASPANPTLIQRKVANGQYMDQLLPIVMQGDIPWVMISTPSRNVYFTHGDDQSIQMPDWMNPSECTWLPASAAGDLGEFFQINVLYRNNTEALAIADKLRQVCPGLGNPLTNEGWINIVPPGVSKSTGVWGYANYRGIAPENIYTVGDSYNDIEMLRDFNGYAMENGGEAIKKVTANRCHRICHMIDALL